jgi:hypothetical protein
MTKSVDQASAALVVDLEAPRPARGHAGHLGRRVRRTNYSQGKLEKDNYGRDHHRAASRSGWPAAA